MKSKIKSIFFMLCAITQIFLCSCGQGKGQENLENQPLVPITGIEINNEKTTLLVGEKLKLDYKITPTNSDESVIISSGNNEIIEVDNSTIIAKNVGETWVGIESSNTGNSQISSSIRIRVVQTCSYNYFYSHHTNELKRATVSVHCKRYNKNWLGKEKDVYIVSGKGTVIKYDFNTGYVLTDKSIFDKISTEYSYEEWYITDYEGKNYPISGIKYHKYVPIGIGSFTSTTPFTTAKVYSSYAYQGDYAVLHEKPLITRVDKVGYYNFSSYNFASASSNVLYYQPGKNNYIRGQAVYNGTGEIIGLNLKLSGENVIAVSSIEIRELYNAIFNSTQQGGGPIDLMTDIG